MSSMLSAPATIPITREATLCPALAPLSVGTLRCSSASPCRPAERARARIGTSPADDTRFGSSNAARAYTALAEARDYGDPVLEHVRRLITGEIIWAPAISGAFVLTTRGGDFDLYVGQDFSIGYASHTDTAVRLYLQETFTFLLLTTEAAVALAPAA